MSHTILLADDSKTIRKAVQSALDREPFDLVAVASGAEAIAKATEVAPAVVIADHNMPGQSGYEVAEALKANPATAGIPVLLLSGTSVPFDEARCRASGAVGHLPKPFDCQGLIDKLSELVGGISDEERAAAAGTPSASAPSVSAAGLPRPPGPAAPGFSAPKPPTPAVPQQMSNIGVTSAPVGTASPLAGDDASISIDLGPTDSRWGEGPGAATTPTAAAPVVAAPAAAAPAATAAAPAVAATPAATAPAATATGVASAASAQVSAAVSAAGVPDSEAVTAATREIIERIVWEVVPELAETMIREELKRLLGD